ncbi:MAG: hypothetical protein J6X67_08770 [Treponema sp.]|nr:hypothetical protein [Treponema sp.]
MKILSTVCFGLLTLLCAWGILFFCGKIRGVLSARNAFKKLTEGLPVLTTDEEVSDALHGEPKVYLVKDFIFYDGVTVTDSALDVLKGEYLCIKIQKETYTRTRRLGKGEWYWLRENFAELRGKFRFNNGVSFEIPENVRLEFPIAAYSNLKKDDVKYDKASKISMARYYPDGLNVDLEHIKQRLSKPAVRYAYAYMKGGEKVTFAARIGNGTVDLNVLDGQNVVRVNGADNLLSKVQEIDGEVFIKVFLLGIGIVFSFVLGIAFLVLFIDKLQNLFAK